MQRRSADKRKGAHQSRRLRTNERWRCQSVVVALPSVLWGGIMPVAGANTPSQPGPVVSAVITMAMYATRHLAPMSGRAMVPYRSPCSVIVAWCVNGSATHEAMTTRAHTNSERSRQTRGCSFRLVQRGDKSQETPPQAPQASTGQHRPPLPNCPRTVFCADLQCTTLHQDVPRVQ